LDYGSKQAEQKQKKSREVSRGPDSLDLLFELTDPIYQNLSAL
jgi:hypothetical protein